MHTQLVATAALVVAGVFVATGSAKNIGGTAGNDVVRGTPAADVINGKAGNDVLVGLGGNDVLLGGPGNDLLAGGGGADTLNCVRDAMSRWPTASIGLAARARWSRVCRLPPSRSPICRRSRATPER